MLTHVARLWLVLGACIAASAAGIVYAVFWGVSADGGRGGAVAVAIAFAALFAERGTSIAAFEQKDAVGRYLLQTGTDRQKVGVLAAGIAAMIDGARLERNFLTVSSVIGTLAWGFGDILAAWCGAPATR